MEEEEKTIREEYMEADIWKVELERCVNILERREKSLSGGNQHEQKHRGRDLMGRGHEETHVLE